MKIGVLTSSRADYGIYLPLLQIIKEDSFFELEIIAFGTHLSRSHGYTLTDIEKDGYQTIHTISSLISNDDAESISTSYGITVMKFADFWKNHRYDLVFCLGDRFEMSAAVQAGIPFGVTFAHFHGGETTLGAIDNVYRHQISLASKFHFTATEFFSDKLTNIMGSSDGVFTVGSLSLNDMKTFTPIEKGTFYDTFSIPDEEFALVTFHPETMAAQENIIFAQAMKHALATISKDLFVVMTMPNADTQGSIYREAIMELKNEKGSRILLIENFGKANYFSAMYYCKLLIGNTSSGIVEAASFGKYVVNVGDRQKGRAQSNNIINCPFVALDIFQATNKAIKSDKYFGSNVYFQDDVAQNIFRILKESI